MHRNFLITIFFIILASCSSDNNQVSRLSELVKPSFNLSTGIIDCKLKSDNSLIDLESFLSRISISKLIDLDSNNNISVLFPDGSDYVDSFLIQVSLNSSKEVNSIYTKFIDAGLDNIANCRQDFKSRNLSVIFNSLDQVNSSDYVITEVLNCSYNESYNFGTFLIAIDRLIQQINFFNPNYRIDYIDVNDSDNFIWINRFEKSYYEDVLPEIWVQNINDSKEIQDEFRENATCEASKKYKEFNIG